jgi:MFS transporter, OFA family, oxalate/formate antiporter
MIANLQYAWTLFVKPLQQGTGWKLSAIQTAATLFVLFQTWVQPAQGWLIDRMGQRIFITIAGILCGIGWAGLGYARSLPMLYALYVLAGIGAALVYAGSMGSALKWFQKERGLAVGVMAAGFGGGTALFIPFIQSSIARQGYRATFVWTGVLQGLVILIVAQFLRHPPPQPVPTIASQGVMDKNTSRLGRHQHTTVEMLSTRQFYVLYIAFVMMVTGGLLLTINAGPIAASWGISAAALTTATSFGALANGMSRIFWGWVSDRTNREWTIATAFTLHAICLLLVATLGRMSGLSFAITLFLAFFTWGEIYALFPAVLADYYGTRHATSNTAVLYSAKGVASIFSGSIAALLYEYFGTWSASLYGSVTLAVCAALIAFSLRSAAAERRMAIVATETAA